MAEDVIKKLIGVWDLADWRCVKDDQYYSHPMGEDAKGRLTYTREGLMSGFLMRQDFENEAPRNPAEASKSLAYSGRYTVKGNEVYHTVDIATIPEWMGTDLIRTMIWKDDKLLLKTTAEQGRDGGWYSNELLWARQKPIYP